MSYTIKKTNGQTLLSLPDGTIDTSTGLFLVGKNYRGYGEFIGDNFVRLAENLANVTPPNNPLTGQLWFNTNNATLNLFNGSTFKQVMSMITSATEPVSPSLGDLWLDSSVNQIKVFINSVWALLGPQTPKNAGTSGIIVSFVTDTLNQSHVIDQLYVNGTVVAIISADTSPFTLQTSIGGFSVINPGFNIVSNYSFNGNTTNSLNLGNIPAASYARIDIDQNISSRYSFKNTNGINIGPQNNISVKSVTNDAEFICNTGNISFLSNSTTNLLINSVTNEVQILQNPISNLGVTNKNYVDSNISTSLNTAESYTDTKFNTVVGNPPSTLNSLEKIANSINNDSNIFLTLSNSLNGKADTVNANLTGNPVATTPAIEDNSSSIATTNWTTSKLSDYVKTETLSDYYHGINPFFKGIATQQFSPAVSDNSQNLVTSNWVHSLFVKGMIMIWPFTVDTIPTGWAQCDGAVHNGLQTPDLRNCFIVGASNNYPLGQTGGNATANPLMSTAGLHNHGAQTGLTSLSIDQLPAHSHSYLDAYFSESGDPSGSDINHYPGMNGQLDHDNNPFDFQLSRVTNPTGNNQGHSHPVFNDGSHTHSINQISTIPPYYSVVFIMKVV